MASKAISVEYWRGLLAVPFCSPHLVVLRWCHRGRKPRITWRRGGTGVIAVTLFAQPGRARAARRGRCLLNITADATHQTGMCALRRARRWRRLSLAVWHQRLVSPRRHGGGSHHLASSSATLPRSELFVEGISAGIGDVFSDGSAKGVGLTSLRRDSAMRFSHLLMIG